MNNSDYVDNENSKNLEYKYREGILNVIIDEFMVNASERDISVEIINRNITGKNEHPIKSLERSVTSINLKSNSNNSF